MADANQLQAIEIAQKVPTAWRHAGFPDKVDKTWPQDHRIEWKIGCAGSMPWSAEGNFRPGKGGGSAGAVCVGGHAMRTRAVAEVMSHQTGEP